MENFIDVQFFKSECSILVRHLYILYSLCGAMYYEKYVLYKFRCLLMVYLSVAYFYCTIPQLKTLIYDRTLRHTFANLGFSGFIIVPTLVIITLYRKKIKFHRLVDVIQKNLDELVVTSAEENTANYLQEYNVLKIHYKTYVGMISFCSFIFFGKLLAALLSYDDQTPYKVDPQFEFFIPFLCDDCNTLISYMLAYTSSYVMLVAFGTVTVGSQCLVFISSIHLKNRAIVLQNTIRFHSELARKKLEKCFTDEEQELNKFQPDDFKLRSIVQEREKIIEEYMSKVRQWIKIHQSFMASANDYRAWAKSVLEVQLSGVWFQLSILGYFASEFLIDDEDNAILCLIYAILYLSILLIYCHSGSSLHDLTGIISEAVYATPWYYLPTKEQKIIFNFLTLSQRGHPLRLFGIYKLNLELFPVILNNAYGYVQIMRLLVLRETK